jgi:hypothetical protein
VGRPCPSGHGGAGRGRSAGHGDLAMDLSTAAWHGFDGGCEAEGASRVEEARAVAGAHVRAVRGEGRCEEEERRWPVGERDEGGEGITSASAQALQPARPKRNGENWRSLGAWFWVL